MISSGIQAYEIQCARADAGVTPLHRDRHCTGTRREIVDEEGERFDLSVKIVETGGQSLRSQLVRTDLTGCLMTDCGLCESGAGSGSHTRRGCVYSGTCKECEEVGTTAKYFGESGRSGYHQFKELTRDIKANNPKNAFAKHLQLKHHKKFIYLTPYPYFVVLTF